MVANLKLLMQTGGPYYQVELGRLDGKVGTRAVVKHSLPGAGFDLDQLNKLFAANGLTQTDMIALSGTWQLAAACGCGRDAGRRTRLIIPPRPLRSLPAAHISSSCRCS